MDFPYPLLRPSWHMDVHQNFEISIFEAKYAIWLMVEQPLEGFQHQSVEKVSLPHTVDSDEYLGHQAPVVVPFLICSYQHWSSRRTPSPRRAGSIGDVMVMQMDQMEQVSDYPISRRHQHYLQHLHQDTRNTLLTCLTKDLALHDAKLFPLASGSDC